MRISFDLGADPRCLFCGDPAYPVALVRMQWVGRAGRPADTVPDEDRLLFDCPTCEEVHAVEPVPFA